MNDNLQQFLNAKVVQYNCPSFIGNDPICIPHQFTLKQDIEIAGFFAALFAWGTRTSIINSCNNLLRIMDNKPYAFIMNWPIEAKTKYPLLEKFVHRTFNATDLIYLLSFLHYHYCTKKQDSLETAFSKWMQVTDIDITNALNGFHQYAFSASISECISERTRKHIAAPFKKSACKRLNMYLRWMVRSDNNGVDFGIWKNIQPAQLICPIDLHVARVAKRFHLLERRPIDWLAAQELTDYLRKMDASDPVKYDFALFGLGVVEKYQ